MFQEASIYEYLKQGTSSPKEIDVFYLSKNKEKENTIFAQNKRNIKAIVEHFGLELI